MRGKSIFTREEYNELINLIEQKVGASKNQQESIRAKIRKIGFYASDFPEVRKNGYRVEDFIRVAKIANSTKNANKTTPKQKTPKPPKIIKSDEAYIIEICDRILGLQASRQHRFNFLIGDSGSKLPVDAYYEMLKLVIEYREKQHSEPVKHFDNRQTVSGVSRGEQRAIYDQRRRDILPKHDIKLIELDYSYFSHFSNKNFKRNSKEDEEIIRKVLSSGKDPVIK